MSQRHTLRAEEDLDAVEEEGRRDEAKEDVKETHSLRNTWSTIASSADGGQGPHTKEYRQPLDM